MTAGDGLGELSPPIGIRRRGRALWWRVAAGAAAAAFVAVGLLGTFDYLRNFWLYRGFPPPKDPAFVHAVGTSQSISIASAALGGRRQSVDVYLPPGYSSHPRARYPVMYLLHGFPGRPDAFLQTVRIGVVEDVLLATHRARPFILVMPFGSTGTFTDKEWANGVHRDQGWETFVARDLVRAVDRRFRTIPNGAHRVLAGLSEGGYGSLNIGLHHPREFRVLESWSGYELASNLKSIFGGDRTRLAANSPLDTLAGAAASLRKAHAYVWLYSGTTDSFHDQNAAFAADLGRYGIPHRFYLVRGGHNWAIWRDQAAAALLAASRHVPRFSHA
jgi:enterochelin esterase-like enzyme